MPMPAKKQDLESIHRGSVITPVCTTRTYEEASMTVPRARVRADDGADLPRKSFSHVVHLALQVLSLALGADNARLRVLLTSQRLCKLRGSTVCFCLRRAFFRLECSVHHCHRVRSLVGTHLLLRPNASSLQSRHKTIRTGRISCLPAESNATYFHAFWGL